MGYVVNFWYPNKFPRAKYKSNIIITKRDNMLLLITNFSPCKRFKGLLPGEYETWRKPGA